MTKLNKTQEKRLNKSLDYLLAEDAFDMDLRRSVVLDHIANELALQKKEIIEELGKSKLDETYAYDAKKAEMIENFNSGIDQAIKKINDKTN